MKKIYLFFVALCALPSFGQLSTGNSNMASVTAELPNVIPPSPTVASLMKFEEVPVDNYTGIPDISIPIYSVPTLSKDITVSVALKYHPGSLPVKEVASNTGLGWNLSAGGVISRTIMGLPDEVYRTKALHGAESDKVGIYNDDVAQLPNLYYKTTNNTATATEKGSYLWNAFEKGIMDSEHDLYQYNFMGHSGRFYIKKTGTQLEVVKLDNDNSLKIEVAYAHYPTQQNRYSLNTFTIHDDKGYKYVFATKEITTEERHSWASSFTDAFGIPGIKDTFQYTSGFHLSEIWDNNGRLIVSFTYQNSPEVIVQPTSIYNHMSHMDSYQALVNWMMEPENTFSGLPPLYAGNGSTISVTTKKLLQIDIINKARIDFELETGRQDTNINADASKLKHITVKNYLGQQVKKFTLNYDYFVIPIFMKPTKNHKRLALVSVDESNLSMTDILSYRLNYKTEIHSLVHNIREDYWGYFRRGGFGKKTDPDYCMLHVLTEMHLPTQGVVHYNFEANTYSYIGNQALNEFDNSTSYTDDIFTFVIAPGQTVSNPLILQPNPGQYISAWLSKVQEKKGQ